MLHIEVAVGSGFEDQWRESTNQLQYHQVCVKFLISIVMTEDTLTSNGVLVLQRSRNTVKVVGLV